MARKNLTKFKEYYTDIFNALQASGSSYFPECRTSEDKAQAAWYKDYWNISWIAPNLANEIEQKGYLNVGICPFCGDYPIGVTNTWKYFWKWRGGPTLNICKNCYQQGAGEIPTTKTNNRKTINFFVLFIIFGYFLTSIIIGINQYLTLEALSIIYIVAQWIILGISIFCTLFFHNNKTGIRDLLATVGGGLAMMDIIQAVLFYFLGGFITTELSLTKIVLLVIIAIAIIIVVYRHLTSALRQVDKNKNYKKTMSKTKSKFWYLLRWIFFIPLSGFIYILSKALISWTFSFISISFVEEMNSIPDFGGYYFFGPIFVFIMESFSVGFGVYSGVYSAPKYKKIVFVGFVCIWALYVSFLSYYAYDLWLLPYEEEGLIPYAEELKGVLFKTLTVFIAASSGLTVAGIFIWKEQKQIKEQKKNDFEILEEH